MLGERKIQLRENKGVVSGASERDTTKIFREFNAHEIAFSYSEVLKDLSPDYFRERRSPFVIEQLSESGYPDMFKLCEIVKGHFAIYLINAHSDRFQRILARDNLTTIQLEEVFEPPLQGSADVIAALIALSFVPKKIRNFSHITGVDAEPFLQTCPDISPISSSEARLLAVTEMLTLNHDQALNKVGFTDSITKDSDEYQQHCAKAGKYMAENSYYGVLTNAQNRGEYNALKSNALRDNWKMFQATELGICPAAPFINRHFQGLGLALSQNRARILELIA